VGGSILAYRLRIIKKKWALFSEGKVSAESYVPKAGFMGEKEELDSFEGELTEVLPDEVDKFAKKNIALKLQQ
jgi:hypothetical protein